MFLRCNNCVFLLLSIYFLKIISGKLSECENKETCSDCIQSYGCIWCVSPIGDFARTTHCKNGTIYEQENTKINDWCLEKHKISPQTSFNIEQNKPFSNGGRNEEPVQLMPQKVTVNIRKGEEFNLKMKYKQAENYPVDLYYLMDLSFSMNPHRQKLGTLGVELARTITRITKNFRLGFGSFVDKIDMPFVSTIPGKFEHPCGSDQACVSPYSFKNHMSLSNNYSLFSEEVTAANVSGNIDEPEGGFDAVMQAIVCKDNIGWRKEARHILVYSSDSTFHIAGDGKLAGVVEPNDEKCHMENNYYTESLTYDYPSVSQINEVARRNNINLIFAIVTQGKGVKIVKDYEILKQNIANSELGILSSTSENVVSLIVDNYKKIANTVVMTSTAPSDIDVKFSSNCSEKTDNGGKCSDVHVGDIIHFVATIKPLQCFTNRENKRVFQIKPEGLKEFITIEVNVFCDCDCENQPDSNLKPNAIECNNSGKLECGICKCNKGNFGKNCQCDETTSHSEDVSNCKSDLNSTEICSGAGRCICGLCECHKRENQNEIISGKFCECNNYSCQRYNNYLCSNNGYCVCGKCVCNSAWSGEACECPLDKLSCISPFGDGKICSGNGICNCGKCECSKDNSEMYTGKFCEECASCSGKRCEELGNCVECYLANDENCSGKCLNSSVIIIEEKITQKNDEKLCQILDDDNCLIIFQYKYDKKEKLVIEIEKEKLCPLKANALGWITGVIGAIVLIGLLTLLIGKLVTDVYDKREYAKFENERKQMKWHANQNPLYKNATSSFENPTFKKRLSFTRVSYKAK